MRDDGMEIRSYRVVFELERRLHRIDRFRIPLPYGLPLRGLAYGVVALLAILALSAAPITSAIVGAVPPPARFVVAPIGLAALLTNVRIDGRPVHRVALPVLRLRSQARRIAAFHAAPIGCKRLANVTIAPDESGARLRSMRLAGPTSLLLRVPVALRARGATLVAEAIGTEPEVAGTRVELRAGQRLVVPCVRR